MWVFDSDKKLMVHRYVCNQAMADESEITYVPGFFKIFDEILVNAADNKVNDPSMSIIKVVIDRQNNQISVHNDGKGIPVEMHKKEGIMIPELIFGHL
jgi:DNA topoisomerase-2